jgi:hypothetical protein
MELSCLFLLLLGSCLLAAFVGVVGGLPCIFSVSLLSGICNSFPIWMLSTKYLLMTSSHGAACWLDGKNHSSTSHGSVPNRSMQPFTNQWFHHQRAHGVTTSLSRQLARNSKIVYHTQCTKQNKS